MRDYAKVSPAFWTGDTGRLIRAAGRDAQVTAFYLLTCPSANMIGLYYLPLPTLCHETGLTSKGALKALQRVSEADFGLFDPPSEQVFVREMAHHQIGPSLAPADNRVKGVIKEWQAMHKSPFYLDFWHRYRDAYHLPKPTRATVSDGRKQSPFEAPSKPGTGTGEGTEAGDKKEPLPEGSYQKEPLGPNVTHIRERSA